MANGKKISLFEFFALDEGDALDLMRARRAGYPQVPQKQMPLSRPQNIHGQELPIDAGGWPAGKEAWAAEDDPEGDFFARGNRIGEHCGNCDEDLDESEQLKPAHAEGDSKWSDPFAGKERMPHEEPHNDPQEKSANAWADQRPCQKLKDFFGGEPFPKGKNVHEADDKKPPVGSVIKGQSKQDLPDELPDDGDDFDWDEFHSSMADAEKQGAAPAAPPADADPWDDVTPDQIAKQTVAPPPPGAPKQRDVWKLGQKVEPAASAAVEPDEPRPTTGIREPSDEDMTWDEFRATETDAAAELERTVKPEELQGGHFQKREDGRIYFISSTGERWGYLGARYGWNEMDFDGESPDGGV